MRLDPEGEMECLPAAGGFACDAGLQWRQRRRSGAFRWSGRGMTIAVSLA
jgi:hypothetical protein